MLLVLLVLLALLLLLLVLNYQPAETAEFCYNVEVMSTDIDMDCKKPAAALASRNGPASSMRDPMPPLPLLAGEHTAVSAEPSVTALRQDS